jgi:hypothetical protein
VLVLAACAAWLVAGVPGARADQPDKNRRAEAERLFRAGEQAYHAGKYAMAAQAFEASYEILPAPQIAFSMAQAYRLQYFVDKDTAGLRRAVELFRLYLEKTPNGGRRDVAITHLAELEPILMRMEAAAASAEHGTGQPSQSPAGTSSATSGMAELMLTSPVAGAEGSLAGTTGPLPLKLELAPGRYEATVTARGYESGTKTIDVVANRFFVVEVPLQPIPARIAVASSTAAMVLLEGRPVARTPLRSPIELSAGSYRVSVHARGHRPWSKEIDIGRGESMALDVELRRTRQRMLSYVVLGFSGVMFTGATLTGLAAAGEGGEARVLERKYEREGLTRSELDDYKKHRELRNQAVLGAYSLLSVGVVTGAVGALLYWYDMPAAEPVRPRKSSPSRPQITPMIERDGVGMSVSGQF